MVQSKINFTEIPRWFIDLANYLKASKATFNVIKVICHHHQNHIRSNAESLKFDLCKCFSYECAFDAFCKMLQKLQRAFVLLKQTASSDVQTLTWPSRKHKVVLGAGKKNQWPCAWENPFAPLRSVPSQCGVCFLNVTVMCFLSGTSPVLLESIFIRGVFITRDNQQTKSENNSMIKQLYQQYISVVTTHRKRCLACYVPPTSRIIVKWFHAIMHWI